MKFETAVDVTDIREPLREFADFVDANPDVWVKVPDGWEVGPELRQASAWNSWILRASDTWVRRTVYWESRTDEYTRQWVRFSEGRAVRAWLNAEGRWLAENAAWSQPATRNRWFK